MNVDTPGNSQISCNQQKYKCIHKHLKLRWSEPPEEELR